MNFVDVAVVGAGPAGVAAAIQLARQGRDVTIIDKSRFPRDKYCGDGLTTLALRLYEELGLEPASIPSWFEVQDVYVSSPSKRLVRFPLPRDQGVFAAVVRRWELDAAFLDLAKAAGVKVLDGHELVGVQRAPDRLVLEVSGSEPIHTPYAIGADGMWSPLRKFLGVFDEGYRGEWHAFRQYFQHVGPEAATHLFVWFEPDLLPGYAWSFPLAGGGANVGFGIQRGHKQSVGEMKQLWPDLLARPHIREVLGADAEAEGPHRAWPIPARIDGVQLTAAGGRALFVGDAAAACDVMTGEGIGQALLTGMEAAVSILDAGPSRPDLAAADYERRVERELVPDHRMSELLVRALRHRKGARAAVRVAGASEWTRRNFARWLFEDYPRGIAFTPTRWRPGLLSGPGAFRR